METEKMEVKFYLPLKEANVEVNKYTLQLLRR